MKTCQDCERDEGVYSFNLNCCLTRFLAGLPSKELRQGWMARLVRKYGSERMELVKAETEKLFAAKRERVLERGKQ